MYYGPQKMVKSQGFLQIILLEGPFHWLQKALQVGSYHPIRVVEQGNYHVIVHHVYSGVQNPMISMLLIP